MGVPSIIERYCRRRRFYSFDFQALDRYGDSKISYSVSVEETDSSASPVSFATATITDGGKFVAVINKAIASNNNTGAGTITVKATDAHGWSITFIYYVNAVLVQSDSGAVTITLVSQGARYPAALGITMNSSCYRQARVPRTLFNGGRVN